MIHYLIPSCTDDGPLVIFIDRESCTGAGELNDEDEEEDNHVEEEHHLVMFHGTNETDNWDEEKEDSTSSDPANYWKTGHYSRHFTWSNNLFRIHEKIKTFHAIISHSS